MREIYDGMKQTDGDEDEEECEEGEEESETGVTLRRIGRNLLSEMR